MKPVVLLNTRLSLNVSESVAPSSAHVIVDSRDVTDSGDRLYFSLDCLSNQEHTCAGERKDQMILFLHLLRPTIFT